MPARARLALMSALLATTAAPTQARADDTTPLDTITVTAASQPVDLSRTGATVDVITAETLDRAPLGFGQLLSRLPGSTLSSNGGLGTLSDLRLRGLPGYYVGARIDGIDVSDPSSPQLKFDFGGLTTSGLSRVEVLRGSQSALYGSEAVAGVVDITTWRPEVMGTSGVASLEAGSHDTLRASGSAGVKTERSEIALSLSRTLTDGVSASALGTEDDGFRGTEISAHARHALTETLSVGANLIAQDSFADLDSTLGDTTDTVDTQLRGGRVFAGLDSGAVTQELSLARLRSERVYSYGTVFQGDRDSLAYSGHWAAGAALSLNWGAERTEESLDVASYGSVIDNGIATNSVFAEALWAPTTSLDLSFALRHDQHSLFGGETSGRLGAAWRPDDAWVIRAVAATGFRAPSPYELWSDYGNTGLNPEESRSFELGAERLFSGGSVKATLFDTRIEDQIQWDQTATGCKSASDTGWPGCYATVSGTTRSRGIELSGEMDLAGGWQVFANYTHADADVEDKGSTTRAARAPRHVLVAGVSRAFASGWAASATARHVADRLDRSGAGLVEMPDYTVADLAVSYELTDRTKAWLRVENLFDEEYQTAWSYAQPGRSVYLGVGTKF